nr:hypothetical protein [Candidatus Delongbacteria bacterium]
PCLQPAGLPILRIISSHLVSLETPTAITQWQSQGIQGIDMEIAYLSDYLAVRDIKFYPVVWGTDYPHRGDTFHLDGASFSRAIPQLLPLYLRQVYTLETPQP